MRRAYGRAVAGDAVNRKLTEAGDEPVLRAILRQWALAAVAVAAPPADGRAAIGFDAHRLEPGRTLRLGGLVFLDGASAGSRGIPTATWRCTR